MSVIHGRRQAGSTLIEILVTLVILAIGILGVFALQTSSLKSNQNSYLRTQATILSYDIMERIRANRQGVNNGSYNNPTPGLTANCLATAGCSSVQMAAHDIAEWQALLTAQLPMVTGIVCIDSTPDDGTPLLPACDNTGTLYAVKTWWDEDRDGTANQFLVISFRP